jgi:hypothetical protein
VKTQSTTFEHGDRPAAIKKGTSRERDIADSRRKLQETAVSAPTLGQAIAAEKSVSTVRWDGCHPTRSNSASTSALVVAVDSSSTSCAGRENRLPQRRRGIAHRGETSLGLLADAP